MVEAEEKVEGDTHHPTPRLTTAFTLAHGNCGHRKTSASDD